MNRFETMSIEFSVQVKMDVWFKKKNCALKGKKIIVILGKVGIWWNIDLD